MTGTAGRRTRRWLIVLAGIIFFQSLLYGPALLGEKILLSLDTLALPGWYLPQSAATAQIVPQDLMLSDLVTQFEPARRFSVSEIQHGRFPLWAPYQFAGIPAMWPKFSPFLLLEYTTASPVILAWAQLFSAVMAGAGMYCFCRGLLHISFWPSAICGWLYPLTAVFIIWYGTYMRFPVCWLPWLFLAVDRAVRLPGARSTAALGLVTGLLVVSGDADIAGQVLLGGGLYSLWCLWDCYGSQSLATKARRAVIVLIAGWSLGIMLGTPHLLPLAEYARTGSRIMHRSEGSEERPPVGLAALSQIVLPDMYGSTANGSCFIKPVEQNIFESPSTGYVGVLAALLLAPLAWLSFPHRRMNWFWLGLAFFGMSWSLGVPGLVQLLRLPGLNLMSHNRLVILTGFALFTLAATGLECIARGNIRWSRWFWLPATVLACLSLWCLYRVVFLPEPVATQLTANGQWTSTPLYFGAIQDVVVVQAWFSQHYAAMGILCVLGYAGWLLLWAGKSTPAAGLTVAAVALAADLLWFDHGRCVQCDPALYFPEIPALQQVAGAEPGRIVGAHCLPANLSAMQGLNDIRGYDAIDPARIIDLLKLASSPGKEPAYATVQFFNPRKTLQPPASVRFPPILDMLNVRYLIARGDPPPQFHPLFQSDDFCALVNSNALPRTYVPRSVQTVTNDAEMLKRLGAPDFDPAALAYVSAPVDLPGDCRGTAVITNEIPTRIMVSVNLQTPAMVVLSDRWDVGWKARWNGQPVDILPANYAIRGVVLPAGAGTLEFFYRPASLAVGGWLAGGASILMLGLVLWPRKSSHATIL